MSVCNLNRCDDFYEFACGEIFNPDSDIEIKTPEDQLENRLISILNDSIELDEIAPFKNAKKFFQSCLNTEEWIERLGKTSILNVLNSMGGWPILTESGNWNENEWTWQQSIARSEANGFEIGTFVAIKLTEDNFDSTKRIIWVRIFQNSIVIS